MHFFRSRIKFQPIVCTFPEASAAAAAELLIDMGDSAVVLRRFACTGTAAHAYVFDGAAESGGLMALKVG